MQHPLLPVDEIPDEGTAIVEFFGREVLVYRVNGVPRASANVCPHLGGPLEQCGASFVCAWHGAMFDVVTGSRRSGPAKEGTQLMRLPTRVIDGTLTYVWED